MTVVESIAEVTESLPRMKQQKVLQFAKSLQDKKGAGGKAAGASKNGRVDRRKLHPALRAIAGMWKDRTDLPKDPVQAVKVLRARMMSRGRNG
jgi:hypothetical protein